MLLSCAGAEVVESLVGSRGGNVVPVFLGEVGAFMSLAVKTPRGDVRIDAISILVSLREYITRRNSAREVECSEFLGSRRKTLEYRDLYVVYCV